MKRFPAPLHERLLATTIRGLEISLILIASALARATAASAEVPSPLGWKPGEPNVVTAGKAVTNGTWWCAFEASVVPGVSPGDASTAAPGSWRVVPGREVVRGRHAVRWIGARDVGPWQIVLLDDLPTQKVELGGRGMVLNTPCAIDAVSAEASSQNYFFHAKRGLPISIEVVARRIGSAMDPWIRILDRSGTPLLELDDVPALEGDAWTVFKAPHDGEYRLEIRDANYRGGSGYFYRLRVGRFPLMHTAFPPALVPGTVPRLELLGATPGATAGNIPNDPMAGRYSGWIADSLLLPVVMRKSDAAASIRLPQSSAPLQLEREPNDDGRHVQRFSIPGVMAGRLGKDNDIDLYEFAVGKGERWRFRSWTRSLGSPCDLFLRIDEAHGQGAVHAAHSAGAEAAVTNTFNAAGTYRLRVEELTRRSGRDFVYRIEAERLMSSIEAETGSDFAAVLPGATAEIKVKITRNEYVGPVVLRAEGLSDAFECAPVVVPEKVSEGVVKISARPGALPGTHAMIRIHASMESSPETTPARCRTMPALRARWPLMRLLPQELDGLICVAVKEP